MYELAKNYFEEFCSSYEIKKEEDYKDSYGFKYYHTYRVVAEMRRLVSELNLSEEEKDIALTIAQFHDLGRFTQLEKMKQYNDFTSSFDHAKESVDILKEADWFKKNGLSKEMEDLVLFAIDNHNKLKIEDTIEERKILFSKLIRDADKLAIMEEWPEYDGHKELIYSINDKVLEEICNGKVVNRQNVESKLDDVLAKIAFVFDINYKESLIQIKKRKLLQPHLRKIKEVLPDEIYERIEHTVKKFLEEKTKERSE